MGLTLPVKDIVQVNVAAASGAIASKDFNQGLIVGSSSVIPSSGANSRIRQYADVAAMLTDGFQTTDPEYIAASLYFQQKDTPSFVWIGRQDLTAIGTAVVNVGGTGYAVGDIVTVTQVGGSNGQLLVTAAAGGIVSAVATIVGSQGTGYSLATGLATTGGSGTGLTVDITVLGESCLEAVEACALVNQDWYPFMCIGAVDADHLALASYSSTNWQTVLYFASSADSAIIDGTANNLAAQMQTANYRALLSYNTTQGGLWPNNIYAAAAIMGEFCGLNTGLAGSAFTLNLKEITGIAPEPITQTQYQTLLGLDCNTVTTFGPYTGYFVNGVLSSAEFADQILYRAMLVNKIQTNLMNLLVATPKIPQTNAGEQLLIAQVDQACADMASIGYLGAGTWEGATVAFSNGQVAIATGDALPLGYKDAAPPYSTQSAADRAARKAMPIYAFILEAGAVHSVTVQVNTQL